MSALEIDYASHATQDDVVEILDEMPPRKKNNSPKSPLKSLRPRKKMRTSNFDMLSNAETKSTKQELEGVFPEYLIEISFMFYYYYCYYYYYYYYFR